MLNSLKKMLYLLIICLCSGCAVSHLKVDDNGNNHLSKCFPLPNCVSSESFMFYNSTAPLQLAMPSEEAWPKIKAVLKNLPGTKVVTENDTYIHFIFRTLVFRFVDNVELLLNKDQLTVSIRSGSFLAIWDIGANWLRIHKIRKILIKKGLIKE